MDTRWNQCATNQKNLAFASIQYEGSKGRLPGFAANYGKFDGGVDPSAPDNHMGNVPRHEKTSTWAIALLPYLDAQPTYEHWTENRYPIVHDGSGRLTETSGLAGRGFHPLAAPRLAIFICPSDPNDDGEFATNSYAANNGMCHQATYTKQIGVDFLQSMSVNNGVFNNKLDALDRNGEPIATGQDVKLSDFRDGQGQTLLFTENLQALPWHRPGFVDADTYIDAARLSVRYDPTCRYVQGVVWHFEDDGRGDGAPAVQAVHRINGTLPGTDLFDLRMTPSNAHDLARPSSAHVDGVNAAMADGGTRFISDSIDYRVYQALLTPCGMASDVPEPDFVLANADY